MPPELTILGLIPLIYGFRLINVSNVSELAQHPPAVFAPYTHGFVGDYGDSSTTFFREHIHSGAIFNPELPSQWNGITISQQCPGMVGPFTDGEYYCVGKQYGYCDQRSGACRCNEGYQGLDCTQCAPEYFFLGGLCYQKKKCPNDCSGQGSCDYNTGICKCNVYRNGVDCSKQSCRRYNPLCTSCNSVSCLACKSGYFPTSQNDCLACTVYDPRCISCDNNQCLACGDFLLNSIRRSGARDGFDPAVPHEELNREFSFQFVYGSQLPEVFDEAEAYTIVPLLSTGSLCTQGQNLDSSWDCVPEPQSHRVCGHSGTFSFLSPTYSISENGNWIPITVTRSGGGVGHVSVAYEIIHVTTEDADVSPTAFYTTSQRLEFAPSVLSLTFYLTIHDNFRWNDNKTFRLVLREPSSGTAVGNQGFAEVTIVENDPLPPSFSVQADPWGSAGSQLNLQVTLNSAEISTTPILVVATLASRKVDNDVEQIFLARALNSWQGLWTPRRSGEYSLRFCRLFGSGLRGKYFSNAWLQGTPLTTRVDRQLNFTWSTEQRWTSFHYGSARWHGYLQAKTSGLVYFRFETNGCVRLWLEGKLLIDSWLGLDNQLWGAANLQNNAFYQIQVDYRHCTTMSKRLNLRWESSLMPLQTIPMDQFYTSETIDTKSVVVTPGAATQVLFRGTMTGIAGRSYSFTFYALDEFENILNDEVKTFRCISTLKTNSHVHFDVSIQFHPGLQLYTALSTPLVSGVYSLHLYLDQREVLGFPIDVQISPSPFAGPRGVVTGSGVAPTGVIAASQALFSIQGKDLFGNLMTIGGGKFQVRAVCTANSLVDLGTVVDNQDGTYTASYTPRFSGAYSIEITVNKLQVGSSPYLISVSPNQPYGPSSHYLSGTGLTSAITGQAATFTIQLRDVNSNLITTGSASVVVASNLTLASQLCTNLLNGQYSCSYVPTVTTPSMLVHVTVNSLPMKNSPFSIQVLTGIAAGIKSIANGTGLLYTYAGQTTRINIQAKDIYGNNRVTSDTLSTLFQFVDGSASTSSTSSSMYLGNGYHEVTYKILVAGNYIFRILANGQDIFSSPFSLIVYPVVADMTTTIAYFISTQPFIAGTILTAQIEPKDIYGNPVNSIYQFQLDPEDISTIMPISTKLYAIQMMPTIAKVYSFQPKIYLPGGGNLTVYRTEDWSGPITAFQAFSPLEMNYGMRMPTATDSMGSYSVLWEGFLLGQFTENYQFNISIHGCALKIYLNHSLVMNLVSPRRSTFTSQLTSNVMVPIQVWLSRSDSEPMSFNLYWSSASQPTQAIPSSSLFSLWKINSQSPTFSVYPNSPSPSTFEWINPQDIWVAGARVTIIILAKDVYGNVRYQGGDGVHLHIKGFNLPPIMYSVIDILDLKNGTYAVQVVCNTSGHLSLTIGIHSDPLDPMLSLYGYEQSLATIHSSPFMIHVLPALPMLSKSIWNGNSLLHGIAGIPQNFTLQLRDDFENVIQYDMISNFQIVLSKDIHTKIIATWKYDMTTKLYMIQYIPMISGIYTIELQVNDQRYTSPIYQPLVLPNFPVASTSHVGNPIAQLHPTNQIHFFIISLSDEYSNSLEIGGHFISVVLHGERKVVCDVIDLLDGTYRVEYTLPTKGLYESTALLMEPFELRGLLGKYYANTSTFSPERIQIDPKIYFPVLTWAKIEWTGYLLGTFTELFTFYFPDGIRLFIDDIEINMNGMYLLIETHLHFIRLECIHPNSIISLSYSSARTSYQYVPTSVLFPYGIEILPRLRILGI